MQNPDIRTRLPHSDMDFVLKYSAVHPHTQAAAFSLPKAFPVLQTLPVPVPAVIA